MGVSVQRYKAQAFMVSSMYAGLAGALLAIYLRVVVPNTFDIILAFQYLAMIVIGGLGSVGGAVAGAVFVTALPEVFKHYSANLPFLAASGAEGVGPAEAAAFLYGAAIIAFLIFEPGGLAGLGRRLVRIASGRSRRRLAATTPTPPPSTGGHP
jgi:branched-chain amino acid transport system permease protein